MSPAPARRRTRRKPLEWIDFHDGTILPDCVTCAGKLASPMFIEAVYSVGIEHPGDPAALGRRTLDRWHLDGHPEPM